MPRPNGVANFILKRSTNFILKRPCNRRRDLTSNSDFCTLIWETFFRSRLTPKNVKVKLNIEFYEFFALGFQEKGAPQTGVLKSV